MIYSLISGVFSGFGLGGGLLLNPLYQQLGISQIQATSTSSFSVFIVSGINVAQALFLGVLTFPEFLFYFWLTGLGGFFINFLIKLLLSYFNRVSVIYLALFMLTIVSSLGLLIILGFSLSHSRGNWSFLLSFDHADHFPFF